VSAPDRAGYAARQAQLLDALLRGDGYPEGFAAAQAAAAGRSLRRKRARAVARAWPALALELGAAFDAHFDAFARRVDAPDPGDPLRDGLAFARRLGRDAPLGDDARAELLLARAAPGRRRPFVGAVRLRRPHARLLVAARLPWLGRVPYAVAVRLPARSSRRCSRTRWSTRLRPSVSRPE
jgi:hypothetical protein